MDYLFPLKLAGRKDSSWKHEKEWRYVYSREGEEYADKRYIPLKEVTPSAIILCPNCSNENKEKVKSIVNDHSIPLYQLVKDYRSKDYNAFKKELLCWWRTLILIENRYRYTPLKEKCTPPLAYLHPQNNSKNHAPNNGNDQICIPIAIDVLHNNVSTLIYNALNAFPSIWVLW